MATSPLESSALSMFCESVAIMLSAGIQTDEAVHMLGENLDDTKFKRVCTEVYAGLIEGKPLASSMEATGAFPAYAVNMVSAGEHSGRLENVLRSLATYYDEEAHLFDKIRSNVGYPAALLCIMSVVLAFTVAVIMPVFVNVFESLSGNLTAGSFAAVNASIVIGWAALIITLICAVVALIGFFLCRSASGRMKVLRAFERIPFTKQAMYQLALSRFTSALSTYIASGVDTDTALKDTLTMVEHAELKNKLLAAHRSMIDSSAAKSLAQAIRDCDVFEPVYARMLMIGTRSGGLDQVLDRLSITFFDDAIVQIDGVVDSIEPALAAFLTVAVGATLISVMLPLIGIMGSIG
ncbi:type II secretion system F family protein [Raoultibacter phocaeensis]|uniref:type II secretion system F family protein n=1 Tax=Raoultibacter phocaeensis TaxID=2479841 RepID=UPI00111A791A|nr:type II secretion system F family protein [Raoultibacter phocaeensis]